MLRVLRGDRIGALPLLERAVRAGADDLAVRIELARSYRLQGRAAEAVKVLAPAVTDSQEPAARRELARARLETKDYAGALADSTVLIEAIDLSTIQEHELSDLIDVYEVGAEAARGVGDSIRAAVLYSAVQGVLVRRNRRDLAEHVRQTEEQHALAFAQRQRETAQVDAVDSAPHFGDLLGQARRYLRRGYVFASLDAAYDGLALDPMSLRPFVEIAATYVAADQPDAAATLLHSIQDVARLRGSEADLAPVEQLLGRIAGDAALRQQAVDRWLQQGEVDEAAAELLDLAEGAWRQGDLSAATAHYRRVLELQPEHKDTTLALAQLLTHAGAPEEALTLLNAAADRRHAEGDSDGALALWAEAVARLPDLAAARRAHGEYLMRRGRPVEGARELAWAAELTARQGGADAVAGLLRVAQVHDELDNLPAALRTYDRLMRQMPGNAKVQEHFVGFCLRRGRPDLAARTLRALVEYLTGRQEHGGAPAAVAALTQLMVLQPDDVWAFERLAEILVQEGREQEAMRVYRQLAARRPDDSVVQTRLRGLIDSLGASTPAAAAPE